jgi:hypothetical protein
MSNTEQVISYFRIEDRINDPCTSFAIKLNTHVDPEEFETGVDISFQMTDTENPNDFEIHQGKIGIVGRNQVVDGKVYDITGRNAGNYLSRQNFIWNCTLTNPTLTAPLTILNLILQNTGISIGLGQTFKSGIKLSNSPNDKGFFGGEFNPKWKALDMLFDAYSEAAGIKKCRWFIDSGNNLKWFEIGTNRGNIRTISNADDIISIDIKKDATNIVNYLEGYGGTDSTIKVILTDAESIKTYGRLEGDNIVDSSITTEAALRTKVQDELNIKSKPIYSGTIKFTGIFDYENGEQVQLIDDAKYSEVIFTVTGIVKEGTSANPVTTLTVTTDESAIVPTNLAENIQAMIDKSAQNSTVATVVQVDKLTNQVLAKSHSSGCLVVLNRV